ncbi:MAG: flagellar hook capping protein [Alphaproteobacteria bacterium]|nr:MAG: flagellar hook capping protein [Alphaproteobacteria bacterium]
MDISATTPQQATAQQTPGALAAGTGLAEDFDTFLTLLTTQLQNQDPLDPADSNEFTRQLVAFAGVEQQIRANQNLEKLSAEVAANRNTAAVGYIGRRVTIERDSALNEGNGIDFRYDLSRDAGRVRLEVIDEQGRIVFGADGETSRGSHEFAWPGINDFGDPAAPGRYRLRVSAIDEAGKTVPDHVFVRAPVRAVVLSAGEAALEAGGEEVPLSEVVSVE